MDEIWDTATRFLANRMKTRSQLEQHLLAKEYPCHEISKILNQFEDFGYLNDTDYAAVYISHCIPKGQTLWRIKRELAERGVSENHIMAGLEQYIEATEHDPIADEFQRGKIQAEKIIGQQKPVDSRLLAKAGRKLISLGYRSETVYAILGEFMRGKNE